MPRLNTIAELEKLRQEILAARRPGPALHRRVRRHRLPGLRRGRVVAAFRGGDRAAGLAAEVDFRRHRLPRLLRARPDRGHRAGGDLLPPGQARGRPRDRLRDPRGQRRSSTACSTSIPAAGERITRESDIPFYKHQKRLVFGDNRKIDPTSIEDYLAIGGYAALARRCSR